MSLDQKSTALCERCETVVWLGMDHAVEPDGSVLHTECKAEQTREDALDALDAVVAELVDPMSEVPKPVQLRALVDATQKVRAAALPTDDNWRTQAAKVAS